MSELISNPHEPLTRGDFAESIKRLYGKILEAQKEASKEVVPFVAASVYEEHLLPLDIRTEALLSLITALLVGEVQPGTMTPESLSTWLDDFTKMYLEDLRKRKERLGITPPPEEQKGGEGGPRDSA